MRAVVQRVLAASVTVDGETVAELPRPGLLALVGAGRQDTEAQARALAGRLWTLRILDDERSAADLGAPLLVVSQFTLYADTRKGRRPSWQAAASADQARPLLAALVAELGDLGAEVATGRFGAHMLVTSVNDGPVTLLVET